MLEKKIKPQKRIQANNKNIHQIVADEVKRLGNKADLNHINVSNVKNMNELFYKSKFNGDISKWNTSNVIGMERMFANSSFNKDISKWDTSSVLSMKEMFKYSAFNQDVSDWDVSNVENMEEAFYNCNYQGELNSWDVGNVSTMKGMFTYAKFNKPLDKWNPKNVSDMTEMFMHSRFNQDISSWNITDSTNTKDMLLDTNLKKNTPSWYKANESKKNYLVESFDEFVANKNKSLNEVYTGYKSSQIWFDFFDVKSLNDVQKTERFKDIVKGVEKENKEKVNSVFFDNIKGLFYLVTDKSLLGVQVKNNDYVIAHHGTNFKLK